MAKKKATARKTESVREKPSSPSPAPVRKRTPEQVEAAAAKLDLELIELMSKRAQLAVEWVGSQPNPRTAVFSPITAVAPAVAATKNQGPLTSEFLANHVRQLVAAARQTVRTQRIAYLGPAHSHTHQAAIQRFGSTAELVPVSTIAAVFEDVNRGHSEFGVVPVENSTDGRVVDTLDMFTRLPIRICGEVQIAIEHNLLAKCPRSEIAEIYSKPQAFSQCRNWLARHMPSARLHDVTSTSTAAQLARDKPGAAAIANSRAAVEYGLQVVASSIQDNPHNTTRFLIIGDVQSKPSGNDRTAILLQIPHRPGALSDALQAFKDNKINLSWIESFPLRPPESGYLFFLDFEGHSQDAKVKKAIDQITRIALRVELLGSYPRGDAPA